ncbi:MAG: hypothetical protein RJA99_4837 [Pseudomonadota bacterium]
MTESVASTSRDVPVLLLASSAEALSMLEREYGSIVATVRASAQVGGVAELVAALQRGDVGLAVAELPELGETEFARIEAALAARDPTALVLVTPRMSAEGLLRAMRAGVREVVLPDSPPDSLAAAIRRQLERLSVTVSRERRGKVLAFMPAKGGSGATFLAANLGYALSVHDQRVATIDLNLQFGDLALFLTERKPGSDVAEVCRDIDRIDGPLLESSMVHASERQWVLAAPASPERAVDVSPDAVGRLIDVARKHFDTVILDLGRVVDAVTIRALDEADLVYVVIQHTIPTLHDARRLLALLGGLGYPADKLQVVANRLEKNAAIGAAEVRKVLGCDVSVFVPNSYAAVAGAINRGEPILRVTPKDPVARSLAEWSDALVPRPARQTGWLRGLFGARA